MKAFEFRLRRVLQLRQNRLQAEESKLEQLSKRSREIEDHLQLLENSIQQARSSVHAQQFVAGAELVSLERFSGRVQRDRTEWGSKLADQRQAVERQRMAVVAARAKVRLLEKLQERQKAEWQRQSDHELEELAADFSAAQWLRSHKRKRPVRHQEVNGIGRPALESGVSSQSAEPRPASE